jgi:hypothetical protein
MVSFTCEWTYMSWKENLCVDKSPRFIRTFQIHLNLWRLLLLWVDHQLINNKDTHEIWLIDKNLVLLFLLITVETKVGNILANLYDLFKYLHIVWLWSQVLTLQEIMVFQKNSIN